MEIQREIQRENANPIPHGIYSPAEDVCISRSRDRSFDNSFDKCYLVLCSVLFIPSKSPARIGYGVHGLG